MGHIFFIPRSSVFISTYHCTSAPYTQFHVVGETENLPKSNAVSEIRQRWIEDYIHCILRRFIDRPTCTQTAIGLHTCPSEMAKFREIKK